MNAPKDFTVEVSDDPQAVPKRVAYVKRECPARFEYEKPPEKLVMSFPHLVIREVIAFQVMVIVLAVLSLLLNAPLEDIANPEHTPNPAKAPWYFLGLQELLHYFPPVVGGVLVPVLVVVALIVIPYFEINVKREGLWKRDRQKTLVILTSVVAGIVLAMLPFRCYAIAVPTALVYGVMLVPYFSHRETGLVGWLSRLSLAEWVMTWFVILASTLTLIGTFFRGPEWRWVWPWREGVYW